MRPKKDRRTGRRTIRRLKGIFSREASVKSFILRWIMNVIALKLTDWCIPGIYFKDVKSWLLTGLVMGLLNAFVRPVLLFLTLPLNILTLGLFTIFLNAAIVFGAGYIVPGF